MNGNRMLCDLFFSMKIADRSKVLCREKNDSVNFLFCIVKAQTEGAQRPRIASRTRLCIKSSILFDKRNILIVL